MCDGLLDAFHRDLFAAKCFLEQRWVLLVGFDGGYGACLCSAHLIVRGDGHQHDVLDGSLFGIRVVVGNQPVPEITFVVEDEVHERHDVVDGGFPGGAAARLPVGETRVVGADVVVALLPVAHGARHQQVGIRARVAAEVRVVEEHTTEFNALHRHWVVGGNVQHRRETLRDLEVQRGRGINAFAAGTTHNQ